MFPSIHGGWIATTVFVIAFVVAYPLVLALIARRKLEVSWRYFGFGALIFFLFQLISRVPLVNILGQALGSQLRSSQALTWIWLFALALTAGMFEEVGRYIGYRWLMRREEKTWKKAVMYGLGHGGLESIVLVGGMGVLSLITLLGLANAAPGSLSAAQQTQAAQAIATVNAQPVWIPLLGAWERLWTIPVHVALSVIVLQVFRRGKINWLWLAILAHFLVDFTALAIPQMLGASTTARLIVEGAAAFFGLLAIWITWSLRDRPEQGSALAYVSPVPERAS